MHALRRDDPKGPREGDVFVDFEGYSFDTFSFFFFPFSLKTFLLSLLIQPPMLKLTFPPIFKSIKYFETTKCEIKKLPHDCFPLPLFMYVRVSLVVDAKPTEEELPIYEKIAVVVDQMKEILTEVEQYTGAGDHIRQV
jgi:hypothetical protein